MPFWVAASDANGSIISGSEQVLAPGPAEVDYPQPSAGRRSEGVTSLVKQTPLRDPRTRTWVWRNLPRYAGVPRYERMVHHLESLLSTTRLQRGLPRWVYLRDTETDDLRVWRYDSGTATATGTDFLKDASKAWTSNAARDGVVEIVSGTGQGQRRSVLSNTGDTLTLSDAWTAVPPGGTAGLDGGDFFAESYYGQSYFGDSHFGEDSGLAGAPYCLQYSDAVWVRCRVLTVAKRATNKALGWSELRMEFCIDDPNWNGHG